MSRAFSETDGRIVRRERAAGSMRHLAGAAVRTLTTFGERPTSDDPPNTVTRLTELEGSTTLRSLFSGRGFIGFDYRMERQQARTWALDPVAWIYAATRLERNRSLPLIGFWQTTCDPKGAGITIERETRWLKLYRLNFYWVYGCQLRGYSKIVGDPEFRIIDLNTIEFEASAALRYPTTYHRCG